MSPVLRHLAVAATLVVASTHPAAAQASAQASAPSSQQASKASAPSVVGGWQGTASVPLKDSTLTVPVLYTFTQNGAAIGGTAMVPGQGAGPISNVVIDGRKIRFRVTATATPAKPAPGKPVPPAPKPNELEHDGAFTADGAIEGMVNLDKQPIAKFRIQPAKAAPRK
jgi:hypothetical protein